MYTGGLEHLVGQVGLVALVVVVAAFGNGNQLAGQQSQRSRARPVGDSRARPVGDSSNSRYDKDLGTGGLEYLV